MPEVSVIISTYNRCGPLREALNSVFAQTYRDFEVIVVDDGSKDRTPEMMKQYGRGVRYIYQENRGVSVARNRGIKEMRGRYAAFLDSDDWWLPEKLQRQMDFLKNNPDVDIVSGRCQVIGDSGEITDRYKPSEPFDVSFEGFLKVVFLLPSVVLMRKEAFETAGYFDEALKGCEDYEFFLRVLLKCKAVFIDEILTYYRDSGDAITKDTVNFYRHGVRIYKKLAPLCNGGRRELLRKKEYECYWLLAQEYRKKRKWGACLWNYFLSKLLKLRFWVAASAKSV